MAFPTPSISSSRFAVYRELRWIPETGHCRRGRWRRSRSVRLASGRLHADAVASCAVEPVVRARGRDPQSGSGKKSAPTACSQSASPPALAFQTRRVSSSQHQRNTAEDWTPRCASAHSTLGWTSRWPQRTLAVPLPPPLAQGPHRYLTARATAAIGLSIGQSGVCFTRHAVLRALSFVSLTSTGSSASSAGGPRRCWAYGSTLLPQASTLAAEA
jgi:hypothetical protein